MRLCSQTEQCGTINTPEGICMLHNSDYVLSLSCDTLHSLKYVRGLQNPTLIWAGPWIQSSLLFFLGMEPLPFSLIFPVVCTNRRFIQAPLPPPSFEPSSINLALFPMQTAQEAGSSSLLNPLTSPWWHLLAMLWVVICNFFPDAFSMQPLWQAKSC